MAPDETKDLKFCCEFWEWEAIFGNMPIYLVSDLQVFGTRANGYYGTCYAITEDVWVCRDQ